MVFSDTGLHIGELPPGRQGNKEHSAFVGETDTADFCFDPLPDRGLYSIVHISPELNDGRIDLTPGINQWLKLFFL